MTNLISSIDWFSLVLGVILGAICSWFITHIYYSKSSSDQKKLFQKLSSDVKVAILENPRDDIRHDELIAILEESKSEPIDASRITGTFDAGTF